MVCTIVFGLGMAASVVLNVTQARRAADDKAQLRGQITDLTYQIAQDRKALGAKIASPSATPVPSAPPTPSGKTVTFVELGVSVTVNDPVSDLTYAPQPKNGVAIVGLSTASLALKYPKCVPSYLGQISKHADGIKPAANENLIKSVNGNSFYFIKPIIECATDAAGNAQRANLLTAIETSVLPTLKEKTHFVYKVG